MSNETMSGVTIPERLYRDLAELSTIYGATVDDRVTFIVRSWVVLNRPQRLSASNTKLVHEYD